MKPTELGYLRALAMLLRQGDPLPVALSRVARRAGPRWAEAATAAGRGDSAPVALATLFPGPAVRALDVASDELPGVLEELVRLLERSAQRQREWQSVLAYPLFILGASGALVWLVGIALQPFVEIFEGMSIRLPMATQTVIFLLGAAHNPGLLLVAVLVGSALFYAVFVNPYGRLRLPVVGKELRAREAQNFFGWLAFLVARGLPWSEAFRGAARSSAVAPIRAQLERAARELEQGSDVPRVSRLCLSWFPPLERWLLAQASEAPEPARALREASRLLSREAEVQGESNFAVVETAAIATLCLAAGFVILAVFLPLYQLIGNLG